MRHVWFVLSLIGGAAMVLGGAQEEWMVALLGSWVWWWGLSELERIASRIKRENTTVILMAKGSNHE